MNQGQRDFGVFLQRDCKAFVANELRAPALAAAANMAEATRLEALVRVVYASGAIVVSVWCSALR